ncbi:MAG: hypothetical protein PHC95_11290 [Parabacteroides sp.]|nr:hypothetical protein [Parabacteroides sp.]
MRKQLLLMLILCLSTTMAWAERDAYKSAADPVNVGIRDNNFDRILLEVSGLDNSQDNLHNTQSIVYSLTNVTENFTLRYTLKDYADWKGKLDIYYGDNSDIEVKNKGTKAEIGEDGSFSVTVSPSQITELGTYPNFLKVLSAKQGELSYDIQVYLASDPANPVFEEKNKSMRFMEALTGSITPRPIIGMKDTEISFTYTIGKTNQWIEGEPFDVHVSKISGLNANQVKLYYISDGKETEIPLKTDPYEPTYCFANDYVTIGTLREGASFTFKMKANTLTNNETISIEPRAKGLVHPYELTKATFRITDTPVVTHAITATLTDLVAQKDLPTVVEAGTDLSYKLECKKEGYTLPDMIQVKMGTKELNVTTQPDEQDAECTYNPKTGEITIYAVNGDVVITAAAAPILATYPVKATLTNLTSTPEITTATTVKEGEPFTFTLKANEGYTLPASITVTMGDKTLAAGTDYTYDAATGAFALEKITAILVITAAGDKIPEPEPEPEPEPTIYTVTLPVVEGATLAAESSTSVESGQYFAFTLTLETGYSAPLLTVKANGSELTPVSGDRYVIWEVTSDIIITVTGIVKDNPTDNAEVGSNALSVWGENGRLHIQTPVTGTARIVTFEGRLYRNLSLPVGETITSMPRGSYIIYIDKQSYKIRF